MLARISGAIAALLLCFLIPIYFNDLLQILVVKLGSGWVFSTIYLRLMVIIFLAVSLNFLFKAFEKTRKLKFWITFIIAILPGIGISFIAPIYEGDYGYVQNSQLPELSMASLQEATNNAFELNGEQQIVCFFTSTCPHCKALSRKLGMNIQGGQNIQVNAFFPGENEARESFINENNGTEFKSFTIDGELFVQNAGNTFPATYLIDKDGNTLNFWSGDHINFSTLDYFLDL